MPAPRSSQVIIGISLTREISDERLWRDPPRASLEPHGASPPLLAHARRRSVCMSPGERRASEPLRCGVIGASGHRIRFNDERGSARCASEVMQLDVKTVAIPRAQWPAAFEQLRIPEPDHVYRKPCAEPFLRTAIHSLAEVRRGSGFAGASFRRPQPKPRHPRRREYASVPRRRSRRARWLSPHPWHASAGWRYRPVAS